MVYMTKIYELLLFGRDFIDDKLYNEKGSDNIRILGKDFVKNNKNKGKLIINNKKYKLKEFININEIKNDIIKINIILSKELSNISHLFHNCAKLKEIFFCDDTRFVNDKGPHLFEELNDYDKDFYFDVNENSPDNCSEHSLYKNIRTDDIYSNFSEITTKTKMEERHDNSTINHIRDKIIIYQHNYYYDMSYMFYNCESLSSLPDISKLNTNKVIDMNGMFYNCKSLSSLPYISKWNTNNVEDMSRLFYNCSSLSSLPDISKWNIDNVNDYKICKIIISENFEFEEYEISIDSLNHK